jgi:hypothetical protein
MSLVYVVVARLLAASLLVSSSLTLAAPVAQTSFGPITGKVDTTATSYPELTECNAWKGIFGPRR